MSLPCDLSVYVITIVVDHVVSGFLDGKCQLVYIYIGWSVCLSVRALTY